MYIKIHFLLDVKKSVQYLLIDSLWGMESQSLRNKSMDSLLIL